METYKEFIENILQTRGRFNCEGYKERHHIIPKCMGGTNDKENLIDLYAREHFIAHRLLALENPHNYKLLYAYVSMAYLQCDLHKRYELSPEEYEEVKIALSEAHKILMAENNPFKGKHHTEETRQRISEANKLYKTKVVLQYDLKGNLVNTWRSAREASRTTGVAHSGIINCANHKYKNRGGYIWRYENDKLLPEDLEHNLKISQIPVLQYSLEGKFIKRWNTVKEAEAAYPNRYIRACMLGSVGEASGFIWLKENDAITDERILQAKKSTQLFGYNSNSKPIEQLDENLNLVKLWPCKKFAIEYAKLELNLRNIDVENCLNNIIYSAGGYIWRYANKSK